MASGQELQDLMGRNPRQVGFYAVLMDVRNAVSTIIDRTSLADVVRRSTDARPELEQDIESDARTADRTRRST
jgi:hypothetical protein